MDVIEKYHNFRGKEIVCFLIYKLKCKPKLLYLKKNQHYLSLAYNTRFRVNIKDVFIISD